MWCKTFIYLRIPIDKHWNISTIFYSISFSPTPDSEIWKEESKRNINDTKYYSDMITYMDKIIGKIVNELKENSILENTLLIFIGDNGTHPSIVSINNGQEIRGAKGRIGRSWRNGRSWRRN